MSEHSPRHLILSLFGLYAREEANWLSVRSLIALMADIHANREALAAHGAAYAAASGTVTRVATDSFGAMSEDSGSAQIESVDSAVSKSEKPWLCASEPYPM